MTGLAHTQQHRGSLRPLVSVWLHCSASTIRGHMEFLGGAVLQAVCLMVIRAVKPIDVPPVLLQLQWPVHVMYRRSRMPPDRSPGMVMQAAEALSGSRFKQAQQAVQAAGLLGLNAGWCVGSAPYESPASSLPGTSRDPFEDPSKHFIKVPVDMMLSIRFLDPCTLQCSLCTLTCQVLSGDNQD